MSKRPLRTVKVNDETFFAVETLRLALAKKTGKSISKGALINLIIAKYVNTDTTNSQEGGGEESEGT